MKLKKFKPEWLIITLAGLIVLTTLFSIFLGNPNKSISLIKWSDASNLKDIINNSAKRLYPILKESKDLEIVEIRNIDINISDIVEALTQFNEDPNLRSDSDPSATVVANPNLNQISIEKPIIRKKSSIQKIPLNPLKSETIYLKIENDTLREHHIKIEDYVEAKSLKKLINKRQDDLTKQTKPYLFALYQSKTNLYILKIITIR